MRIQTCNAFTSFSRSGLIHNKHKDRSPLSTMRYDEKTSSMTKLNVKTITTTYETTLVSDKEGIIKHGSKLSRLRRRLSSRTKKKDSPTDHQTSSTSRLYRFTYDYNELVIGSSTNQNTITAVMLIHPIGVGIGRWYYDRLLQSLKEQYDDINSRVVFITPDLLGSATACGPIVDSDTVPSLDKLPLLNITDWSDQVSHLMSEYETKSKEEGNQIVNWSIVANGGCAPIALKVAADRTKNTTPFKASVTTVMISSPPRLPFFIECNTDPKKVYKSYRTLCGLVGKAFWWYSLRKSGKFIQKFSEKNLVGDPANLGEEWLPNCLAASTSFNGQCRYSIFAFLAGSLQDGCIDSLNTLKGSNVAIDFIRGEDKRRNSAKSVFWTRKKRKATCDEIETSEEDTIQQYVSRNGNRGNEIYVKGRISLAWEDSDGYATGLMKHISE